jgi:hypothetical protein
VIASLPCPNRVNLFIALPTRDREGCNKTTATESRDCVRGIIVSTKCLLQATWLDEYDLWESL